MYYHADSANPLVLDSVTFSLEDGARAASAARFVAVRLETTDGVWYKSDDNRLAVDTHSYTSADGAGIHWTCDVSAQVAPVTVLAAKGLTVVATADPAPGAVRGDPDRS